MRLPRIFHKLYAWSNGYFWLPCPICGEYFGGHEVKSNYQVIEGECGFDVLICNTCHDRRYYDSEFATSYPPLVKNRMYPL